MSVSANQVTPISEDCRSALPVAASTRIYERTLCFVNASGYLDDDTASGVNAFAGLSVMEVDNSSGSNGDKSCEFWTEKLALLTGSGFSQASVGKDAFASDNYSVTTTPTASTVRIGKVVRYVSATKVWVELCSEYARTNVGAVEVKTADYTITAADSGKTYDSTGAAGTIVGSLPVATPGLHFYFRVGAAQEHRLDPNGTETISLPSTGVAGAAGKYLSADAAGETVHLRCVKAGTWSVFGYTGTWTAEA